jgi:hypothetical protein
MIWQKVALKAGHRYVVDAAFKDLGNLPIQAFWCQWFVEKKTPVIAEDPYPEASARAQINTWNSCLADYAGIDITLQTWECENGAQSDTVVVSQDTIYTYGVKMGVYNAAVVSYDIVIDNMSLLDIDTLNENAISTINAVSVNVFPNPATDVIYIENASQFTQASILNVLGQEVMYVTKLNNSIDVAGLRSGMYFIKLTDKYNNIAVSKFQKQ